MDLLKRDIFRHPSTLQSFTSLHFVHRACEAYDPC
jgi:hypothetical protein